MLIAFTEVFKGRSMPYRPSLALRSPTGMLSYSHSGATCPFKHGHSVILTASSCGQIMYAFLMRPDTLPPSYNRWFVRIAQSRPGS